MNNNPEQRFNDMKQMMKGEPKKNVVDKEMQRLMAQAAAAQQRYAYVPFST